MKALNSDVASWLADFAAFATVTYLKLTVVLAATALLLVLMRRRPSQLRYAIATAGLLLAATLPLWERVLPARSVWTYAPEVLRDGALPLERARTVAGSSERSPAPLAGSSPARTFRERAPRTATSPPLDWKAFSITLAIAVWLVGSLVLILLRARDLMRIRGLTAIARAHAAGQREAERLAERLGIAGPVRVRTHPTVKAPLSWGFRTAEILLPPAAKAWTTERLRVVLMHELAHVRRHDYWGLWAVELARIVYWVHPLVWWLARRSAVERELACDDAVIRMGIGPLRYADTLVELARDARRAPLREELSAGLAAARFHGLAARVKRILDDEATRSARQRTTLASLGVLILVTLGAAPWTGPRASDPTPEPATSAPSTEWIDALEAEDPALRRRAAWALGEQEASEAVPHLIAGLDDGDPSVREVAAWALGEIKDPRALPALEARLVENDPLVREMILRAMGEHEDPSAIGVLARELDSENPAFRRAAVFGLAEIAAVESWSALSSFARAIDGEPDPGVRLEVLGVLARKRGELDAFTPFLSDRDARVRAEACRILGRAGSVGAVDFLLAALRDPDAEVRAAAAWSLDEINPSRHR